MKLLLLLRRIALLVPLLGFSLLAQASHFRFGSITYQTNGATNRDVTFRVSEAWRDDAFGSPPVLGQVVQVDGYLDFGDGSSSTVNLTVTTVGAGYFYGEAIINHTYATAGTYVANVYDCCRISTLQNNADRDFYFSTPVAAGNANDSPVSTLLPIVNLPAGQAAASYTLPATDPNGNTLTYSVATAADLGNISFTNAPGLAVNSATGQVTFSTVGKTVGQLYNAVIKVSDGSTSIILDHIIQISSAVANTVPVFTAPTPANGTVYTINPGQLLSFTVRATDADAGDNVTLQALGAPAGASTVPALPTVGNPVQAVFSFTPTAAQVGSYVVSFVAQDNAGAQTTTSVTIQVQQPAATVGVLYRTGDLGQPADNVIRPYLQLINTGTTAVPYQGLTIRYWLTAENYAPLVTQIDWAKLGTSFVSVRYVMLPTPRQGAYGYVEYSFAAGAGNLAAGGNSGDIYTSFHKQNWTNFDETDDWSYQTSSSFTANAHLTVYQNGTLISGTEPTAVASTTSLKVYAGNQDTSPTTSYISVYLQVGNVGNVPVNFADLKVRYWFTPDGTQPLVYQLDYTPLGAQNFSLQTGQKGTETYAELSFAAALGAFYPMGNTGNIQFKIRKDNYSAFTQTNDYSFSSSSALVEQPRITAYLNGQLVFGTEPAGASATAARMAASAAPAAASATASRQLPEKIAGSPNPFTDNVQLSFTLPQTEAYTLAVYDVQGRLLEGLPGGTAAAGEPQQLVWAAGRHAAGLYLVRLVTPSTTQQFRLVKK